MSEEQGIRWATLGLAEMAPAENATINSIGLITRNAQDLKLQSRQLLEAMVAADLPMAKSVYGKMLAHMKVIDTHMKKVKKVMK